MTFYDENGNIVNITSDNTELLEALTEQSEKLEELRVLTESQAKKIAEMNQYTAYIFVIILAILLYRILSSALSSIFGGG